MCHKYETYKGFKEITIQLSRHRVQFVSPVNLSQRYHRKEKKTVKGRGPRKTNAKILEWFNLLGEMRKTRESKSHKIKYAVCRRTWTKENWIWRMLWTDEVIDDGHIFFGSYLGLFFVKISENKDKIFSTHSSVKDKGLKIWE